MRPEPSQTKINHQPFSTAVWEIGTESQMLTVSRDAFTDLAAFGASRGNPYPAGSYSPLGQA
jgi:hypothetical protein